MDIVTLTEHMLEVTVVATLYIINTTMEIVDIIAHFTIQLLLIADIVNHMEHFIIMYASEGLSTIDTIMAAVAITMFSQLGQVDAIRSAVALLALKDNM